MLVGLMLALFGAVALPAGAQAQVSCPDVGSAADDNGGTNPSATFFGATGTCSSRGRPSFQYDNPIFLGESDDIEIMLPDETPRPASGGNPAKIYSFGATVSASCPGATVAGNNTLVVTLTLTTGASCSLTVDTLKAAGAVQITGTLTRVDADDYTLTNVVASGGNFSGDTTAPTITSVARQSPASENTDSDTLTWRVTFSEDVRNVDAADFAVNGTSATATGVTAVSATRYDITASGGDLAGLINTSVSLGFAGGQNIQDTAGNALANTTPTGVNESYTVDNTPDTTPPTLDRFIRFSGSSRTNGNSVVFGANFSEPVVNVSAGDFTVNGGAGTVSGVTGSGTGTYQITVDGLAGFNGVIGLDLAASADIEDAAGNRVIIAEPPTDMTFTIDNAGPVPTISALGSATLAQSFTAEINFDELVSDFDISDIVSVNATLSNFSGSRDRYFVSVNPTGGDLTLDILAGAAHDALGNASSAATTFTVLADAIPPTITQATRITANANGGVTNSDTLEASLTFSEPVQNISGDDFTVTGLTGASIAVSASSGTSVNLTVSGGDLANFDGSVEIRPAAGQDITDAAGNPLDPSGLVNLGWQVDNTPPPASIQAVSATDPVSGPFDIVIAFGIEAINGGPNVLVASEVVVGNGTLSNFQPQASNSYTATVTPSGDGVVTVDVPAGVASDYAGNLNLAAPQFSITSDATAPAVTLSSSSPDPVSGAFTLTATFTESVTGFELSDLTVGNGTASNFNASSGTVYTVTITPTSDGQVTVDIAAGVATDSAGNANTAATQFTITNDATPPVPTIALPGSQVEGAFTASFTFSEDVVGFDASDINVTNGAASGFTTTNARTYSTTITPGTVGQLTISLAANAAQDGAGNASTAASDSLTVVFPTTNSNLNLGGSVADPTTVSTTVNLTNPGSQAIAYTAASDVTWLAATPASGTIPGSGNLSLTIALTAAADQLAAGTYNGTVTVSSTTPSAVITTIPVTLTVAPRFGSIRIVATTPGGTHGNETFTYASGDAGLNGLSLTTASGTASSATFTRRFGSYDITQSLPVGWELDTLSCAGDADSGSVIDVASGRADIDLDPNETIVCTFANSRDDDAVRIATQRAINNYLVRRADRIVSSLPQLNNRLRAHEESRAGDFAADVVGGEYRVAMNGSLAGMRAQARDGADPDAVGNPSRFDLWVSAEFSGISDDRAGDSADSEFGVVQIGADWLINEKTVVGLLVQRDWMDETQETIAVAAGGISPATIDGAGWMAGPYLVHEFAEGVVFDVLAMYGQSDNDINPLGFYEDSFSTDRFVIRATISGEWAEGPWRIRPSASITHFSETQDSYTDSLGIVIPEQSIEIGRFTAGPEFAYRWDQPGGGYSELHGQINANFDYNPAGLMDATGRVFDTGTFRADSRVGLRTLFENGATLDFEVNLSGLGESDFEASGARIEFSIPLGG